MQQHVLPAEGFGQREGATVHMGGFPVGGETLVHNAGKGGFHRERNQYRLGEERRAPFIVIFNGGTFEILPDTVKVHPVLPLHGRTGVFLPHVVGSKLFAPGGHHGSRLFLPYTLRIGASCKGEQHGDNCHHATRVLSFHNLLLLYIV